MNQSQHEQPAEGFGSLTDRELEIIELMRAGLANKEIARQMSLAYETIKWYTKRIYNKLNVKNRNQLMAWLQTVPQPAKQRSFKGISGRWVSPLTPFIGRTAEKEALLNAVAANRLVSLIGPGGIGKTRLALEIGQLALSTLERQPFFISAESFHSRGELVFALADLFHISLNYADSPINQIAAGLPSTPTILIIDNFETIIDASADLVTLLSQNQSLHILLTSRLALRLAAEIIIQLDGLTVGDDDPNRNEAVHLFRARAYRDGQNDEFRHDHVAIAEICQMVGGNPLAIELAASWTRSLTSQQILTELKDGLNILTSEASDIEERHRSMEAICEQSWTTLKPIERKAALKLTLFENRFTWEAAREIASLSLATITALLNQSIIRRVPGGHLSMHPVLRRFIQDRQKRLKFDQSGTQRRFTTFYIQRLITYGAEIHSARQVDALNAIDQELDHILQAWRWATQAREVTILKQALEPLALFFEIRDHTKQGAALFAETLTHFRGDDELTIGLRLFQGWYDIWLGNSAAGSETMLKALEILDRQGLTGIWPMPIAMLSFNEQFPAKIRSELEARFLAERDGYLARGDQQGAAWMAYGLGNITRPTEQFERSAAYFREGLRRFQDQRDDYGISLALDGLSTTLFRVGDLEGAWETALLLKGKSLQLGNTTHLAVTGEMFGLLCEKRGDPEDAFREYLEGLRYGIINTNASNIVPHLYHLGRLMAQHDFGSADWAVTLLTLVQTHPDSQEGWFAFRLEECERWLNHLQNKMPRDRYLAAVVNGREMKIVEGAKRFIETTVSSNKPAP